MSAPNKSGDKWPHSQFAGLLFLLVARAAFAAPPDFAQAPADAVWLVHVDCDALHQSTVYKKLIAVAEKSKPLVDRMAKVNEQLGMDVAKDMHGMTVFGPRLSEHKATLVMHADWDPRTFEKKLSAARDHGVSSSGNRQIHRFTRRDGGQDRTLAGACWKPGTFVFAQTSQAVETALDVLDGKRPALAKSSPLAAEVPPGTVFLARMIEVGNSLPVESPLLKQTEEINLACGENAGECFIRGKLVAKTSEAAEQVKTAADGLLAMARLQAPADDGGRKLLDRVQMRLDGRAVLLDFHIPADELSVQLQKALEGLNERLTEESPGNSPEKQAK